ARSTLEMAVGLKKDSSAAHASLGSLLAAVGQRQQAIKHLNTAIKLKPSAPVHFLIGAVYYGAGQHRRAIQHLRQATKLDPQFGEAHYQLGLLCLEMNWLCLKRTNSSAKGTSCGSAASLAVLRWTPSRRDRFLSIRLSALADFHEVVSLKSSGRNPAARQLWRSTSSPKRRNLAERRLSSTRSTRSTRIMRVSSASTWKICWSRNRIAASRHWKLPKS